MDELKALYGQAFTYYDDEIHDPSSYYWFAPKETPPFGIRKSGITDKELHLLKLFYPIGEPPHQSLTADQKKWSGILFRGETPPFNLNGALTQFIYIHFKNDLFDQSAFEEAIMGYFSLPTTLLWADNHFAVLVASIEPTELPEGETLLELINTDFFVNAKLAFGSPFREIHKARPLYQHEKQAFETIQKAYPERNVFYYAEFLPLTLLISGSAETLSLHFGTLTDYLNEETDLRAQLEVFFSCNLNISTTAKALFMHRNSLVYRFDKLKEKTGLDPREFKDAQLIHLELLFNKRKH